MVPVSGRILLKISGRALTRRLTWSLHTWLVWFHTATCASAFAREPGLGVISREEELGRCQTYRPAARKGTRPFEFSSTTGRAVQSRPLQGLACPGERKQSSSYSSRCNTVRENRRSSMTRVGGARDLLFGRELVSPAFHVRIHLTEGIRLFPLTCA